MPHAKTKKAPPKKISPLAERGSTTKSRMAVVSMKSEVSRGTMFWSRLNYIPAMCLLLALATASIYAPLARHEFIDYDDDRLVVANSHVNTGLNWQNVRWALTADATGNWHPMTWISHALDCQLYGLDKPGGHHATNLLLHVLNVLLLFLLLFRVTGARGRSFVVAALFALHPFNVESVAWVAERKNILCTLFFLLALGAYGWYAQKPGLKRYLCVAALFVLGLASKPMVITLPFVLLLLDFWPLRRVENWSTPSATFTVERAPFSRLVLEKLPLLALSAASAVITIVVQRRGNSIVPIAYSPLTWRLENAVWAYWTYLWKTFVPLGLAPFYPTIFLRASQVALASLCLLATSWLVWRLSSGRPYIGIGFLWFLGTLVPVIGIVQVGGQSMADRYAYIPLIGLFVAVVWGVYASAQAKRIDIRWLGVAASIALVALSLITWRQVSYWKNSISLWSHALDVTSNNFVAEEDLAVGLANQGRDDEALPHFVMARRMRPDDPIANLNIGINLEQHGRHQAAIRQFEMLTRLNNDPDHLDHLFQAHKRLGVIYTVLGDRPNARAQLLQALQLRPDDLDTLADLGALENKEIVDKLSDSVSAHPTAEGYFQLGQALEQDHKIPDAQAAYQNALRLNPKLTAAQQALTHLHGVSN